VIIIKDSFGEDISNRIRMAALLDLYGKLLTKKQFDVMSCYYLENYSLSEISVNMSTSRQCIFDTIKKGNNLLENYETKLGFMTRL
jgi:predicted DNA-binding protein YlxM (UPF0122 family)